MFRSRVLIVSNGGVQGLHPELFNWFPNLDRRRVFASDEMLRNEGYSRAVNQLNQKQ